MVITFFLVLGLAPDLRADFDFILQVNSPVRYEATPRPNVDFTFRQVSELRFCLSGMIRLYQLFVSPQSPPGCNFTLTCSHFMTQSIQKYGILHGLLMESDRLTRCNHNGRRYYPRDRLTGQAIDYPIEAYYLFQQNRIRRGKPGE